MKRVFSIVLALTMLVALAVPAFAAEFVGSVEAKPAPSISKPVLKDKDGKEVAVKTAVVSLEEALKAEKPEGAAAVLVEAYKQIKEGKATMPGKDMVVSHLMDVSVDEATTEALKAGGTVDLTFNIGVKAGVKVAVLTYNDGKWEEVKAVKNNGDGTVTATFAHFCPVAFATSDAPAKTGDAMGNNMIMWTSVLVLSAAAVVALVVIRRKSAAK